MGILVSPLYSFLQNHLEFLLTAEYPRQELQLPDYMTLLLEEQKLLQCLLKQ